jgi:hypothetical protein
MQYRASGGITWPDRAGFQVRESLGGFSRRSACGARAVLVPSRIEYRAPMTSRALRRPCIEGRPTNRGGLLMGQPVVHFEIIGNDPQNLRDYYAGLFGWEFDTPSPVAQEVSEPESCGFWTSSPRKMGQVSGVVSGAARATRATPSSTLASRMSRLRCSERRGSEAHGSWVQPHHRMVLSSVTSRTPRAP